MDIGRKEPPTTAYLPLFFKKTQLQNRGVYGACTLYANRSCGGHPLESTLKLDIIQNFSHSPEHSPVWSVYFMIFAGYHIHDLSSL